MNKAVNLELKSRIIANYGTQYAFAEKVGADESLVSRVIRGRKTLNFKAQRQWAKLLKSSPKKLFG